MIGVKYRSSPLSWMFHVKWFKRTYVLTIKRRRWGVYWHRTKTREEIEREQQSHEIVSKADNVISITKR